MNESVSPVISDSRFSRLLRVGAAVPRFLQGVFPFAGRGMFDPAPLDDALSYTVPAGRVAEFVYFRGGNLSDDLIYVCVTANGSPIRYFPIGPKGDAHVSLAIVEQHPAGVRLDVCLAAPRGLAGSAVVDVGFIELEAGG